MRGAIKLLLLWGFCTPLMLVSYTNCGQFSGSDSSNTPYFGVVLSSVEEQNFTVQSAEQIARSMASVTGVTFVDSILNEYNSRKSLMTTDYSLESVSAPMMISIANLGSQYCNELLRVESAQPAAERKFFGGIDFSKAVSTVDDTSFNKILTTFGHKFWGRELSAEERAILIEGKQEFIRAIPANATTSSAQTRALMLSTCTAVIASLDFILI